MKNPNGYGTVVKLSGNRRKPYAVREGKTGKQKTIGYAESKEAGLIMLSKYNESPWDIETASMTFEKVYRVWEERKGKKLPHNTYNALRSVFTNHCKNLYTMKYKDLRSWHFQDTIDQCPRGYSTKNSLKSLFTALDKIAFEMDIIDKMYSAMTVSAKVEESDKEIFTDEEISLLWANKDVTGVESVLFLIYTGFRVGEFLSIKTADVDLETGVIRGGSKTAAGKNRLVPIHPYIREIVERRVNGSQSGYLWEEDGKPLYDRQYRRIWAKVMDWLHLDHIPHECRHTFRSMLDSAGANSICIDRMMGHRSRGVGERVYTHKTIEELKTNIELVTKK